MFTEFELLLLLGNIKNQKDITQRIIEDGIVNEKNPMLEGDKHMNEKIYLALESIEEKINEIQEFYDLTKEGINDMVNWAQSEEDALDIEEIEDVIEEKEDMFKEASVECLKKVG